MPKTYDRQSAAFLAKVAECMPNMPSNVMQCLMENPAFLKRMLEPLQLWGGQRSISFRHSTMHIERNLQEEIHRSAYLPPWGQRAFESAFEKAHDHKLYGNEVRTVRVKLSQLGFAEQVSLRDFKARAARYGLIECPQFVAYHYRLRYKDQPLDETLYIFTESIDLGNGEWSVFGLTHRLMYASPQSRDMKKVLVLDGHYGHGTCMWSPESEWVFALNQ